MGSAVAIPLRFQRLELQEKAAMSEAGLSCLGFVSGPQDLLTSLVQAGAHQDALSALALMLPRRQSVWWACLAVRLIPDLPQRPAEAVAVDVAESWVQTQRVEDCERASNASEMCPISSPATYAALAAYWSGPTLAPRGQQPVAPAPFLTGIGVRSAMILTLTDRSVSGRVTAADLLAIGTSLMHGETGRNAQAAVRERLATSG